MPLFSNLQHIQLNYKSNEFCIQGKNGINIVFFMIHNKYNIYSFLYNFSCYTIYFTYLYVFLVKVLTIVRERSMFFKLYILYLVEN